MRVSTLPISKENYDAQMRYHTEKEFWEPRRSVNITYDYTSTELGILLGVGLGVRTGSDFPGGSDGNASAYTRGTRVRSLGGEDPLEKERATHSSTVAWKRPWTEEPGRPQSMGSQRVWHNWATSLQGQDRGSDGPRGICLERVKVFWKL